LPLNPANPQDGITLSGFYVDTDTWNAASYPVSQTMYVCDYDNWYVVANMNNSTGDGAVKTYPNVHKDFTAAPQISSFSTISSSFAETAPHVGIYEYAYDIWLNGVAASGSTEVMIWTDNYNQVPSGSVQETVTFDGQSYKVYKSGSYIAFVETANVTSGTVNLLTFFNHIIAKGWIAASSTLGAIDYGVELVSTSGANATFQVDNFSLTTN
jgi:Glycosyl hydrolase family 12